MAKNWTDFRNQMKTRRSLGQKTAKTQRRCKEYLKRKLLSSRDNTRYVFAAASVLWEIQAVLPAKNGGCGELEKHGRGDINLEKGRIGEFSQLCKLQNVRSAYFDVICGTCNDLQRRNSKSEQGSHHAIGVWNVRWPARPVSKTEENKFLKMPNKYWVGNLRMRTSMSSISTLTIICTWKFWRG